MGCQETWRTWRTAEAGLYLAVIFGAVTNLALAETAGDVSAYCSYLSDPAASGGDGVGGSINFCEALSVALRANPALEATRLGVEGAAGRLEQAALLPNPSLEASLEDFAGSGSKRGFETAETTVQWNQPIELGGKRRSREGVALSEKALAQTAFELRKAEVILGVKIAFVEVLAARESLALGERRKSLAEESMATTRRRIGAGAGSAVEGIKAKISLSNSEIDLDRSRRELNAAHRKLAGFLNQVGTEVSIRGELEVTAPPPGWETFKTGLLQSPELKRAKLEIERRRASVSLEESKATQDVTFSAGMRRARADNSTGFLVGLTVPLPITDRNQGAILEAHKALAAEDLEGKSESLRLQTELRDAYDTMESSFDRAKRLKADVLQNAERGLDGANKAYRLGKLNYLDVLDAQRTLFDAREEYVRALTSYHTSLAQLERLLGRGIGQITGAK